MLLLYSYVDTRHRQKINIQIDKVHIEGASSMCLNAIPHSPPKKKILIDPRVEGGTLQLKVFYISQGYLALPSLLSKLLWHYNKDKALLICTGHWII